MRASAMKNYLIRMVLIMTCYMITLFTVKYLDQSYDFSQPVRIALAILPVLPAIVTLWIFLAFFRAQDELMQRIMNETTIISTGIVGIGTFMLGFLHDVIPLPGNPLIFVFPAMIAVYGVVQWFVIYRYYS